MMGKLCDKVAPELIKRPDRNNCSLGSGQTGRPAPIPLTKMLAARA